MVVEVSTSVRFSAARAAQLWLAGEQSDFERFEGLRRRQRQVRFPHAGGKGAISMNGSAASPPLTHASACSFRLQTPTLCPWKSSPLT
jgi:hypothetical protein